MFFVTIIKSTVSNSMFLKGITWFSMLLPLLVSIKDSLVLRKTSNAISGVASTSDNVKDYINTSP